MAINSTTQIPFKPVKSFFVDMLTRDISLEDAILDLIDNCVDGVRRIESRKKSKRNQPYIKYYANIKISENKFEINDNCGGIPWSRHEYAFRLGRIKKDIDKGIQTVGVYGIGMKRAIFKIGQDCIIETHAKDKSYKIHLTPDWIKNDENWDISPQFIEKIGSLGTNIKIKNILPTISSDFSSVSFLARLNSAIASHFSFIIDKGFKISINGSTIKPKPLKLLFESSDKEGIRPFIYKTKIHDVDIILIVGFSRPIPSAEEASDSLENYKERYSSSEAGWTIVCNDRTILYYDKSSITGWGLSGVPQYHMQFRAIAGIVIFNSKKPDLLPTTTTKRGVDSNSELFMFIKDKMIEGMKLFTQYTNQWKSKELSIISKKRFSEAPALSVEKIEKKILLLKMKATKGIYSGSQYKPQLPRPKKTKVYERISFKRKINEIKLVSKQIFNSTDRSPAEVGEKCFELILKEVKE